MHSIVDEYGGIKIVFKLSRGARGRDVDRGPRAAGATVYGSESAATSGHLAPAEAPGLA